MASIASSLQRIKDNPLELLDRSLIERVCRENNHIWRERELDPATTIALFMQQVLRGNIPCSEVRHLSPRSFTTQAYGDARARIPLAVYQTPLNEVYQRVNNDDCVNTSTLPTGSLAIYHKSVPFSDDTAVALLPYAGRVLLLLGARYDDETTAKTHVADPIAINGRTYSREDIPAILGATLDALPKHVRETIRVPLGIYRGLRFGIVMHSQFPPEVYLEGATTFQTMLSREHQGPRAVLNGLERLVGQYRYECARVRQNIVIAEAQLRDYGARLGKPFTLDAYLFELTALRDQLKAGLSGASHEPGNENRPSIPELAERIKALRAANNIEAAPQRVRQKPSSAEEPITARIRRRTEALPASTSPIESDAASVRGTALPQNSSVKPQATFQERIVMERERKDQDTILS